MSDRFEDVRTFVAVVQGKGFNAAADHLGLVKSAVSRRIRDLEDRLGTRLLNRTTRQLSLTDTGAEFFERCVKLLADLQEAEELAAKGAQEAIGRLRVAAPVSFTIHCLAPKLKLFLEQNPRLEVELVTDDRLVDIVSEGFDLAVRISRLQDSSLIGRSISPIHHVACASPAYLKANGVPLRPAELERHCGIVYSNVDPRSYWTFRDGETAEVRHVLWMNNGDAIREAAIAGCGVAFLPTFIVSEAIRRGELQVILRDYLRPPTWLNAVYPSSRNVPLKVRRFIDFLITQFGERPYWDEAVFGETK